MPALTIAAVAFVQAAIMLVATLVLSQAADRGARQAALPRATCRSVATAVDRALAGYWFSGQPRRVELTINGWPASDSALACAVAGDRIEVSIAMPMLDVAPDLLRWLGLSISQDTLRASATAVSNAAKRTI